MIPLTGWSHWQHNALPFSPEFASQALIHPGSGSEPKHLVIPFNQPRALFANFDAIMESLGGEATAVTFLYLCGSDIDDAEQFAKLKGLHALGQTFARQVQVTVCSEDIVAAVKQIQLYCQIEALLIDGEEMILKSAEVDWLALRKIGVAIQPIAVR